MNQTPRTFSHIGLSVPDLDAAVKFYTDVLGFYVVMQPSEAIEDDSAIGEIGRSKTSRTRRPNRRHG